LSILPELDAIDFEAMQRPLGNDGLLDDPALMLDDCQSAPQACIDKFLHAKPLFIHAHVQQREEHCIPSPVANFNVDVSEELQRNRKRYQAILHHLYDDSGDNYEKQSAISTYSRRTSVVYEFFLLHPPFDVPYNV
jgi:hypothetical protein